MKTFDEAMAIFCRDVKEEEATATLDAMADALSSKRCIAQTILESDLAQSFVEVHMPEGPPEPLKFQELLMSMFINGVIVGMEMEKQELVVGGSK